MKKATSYSATLSVKVPQAFEAQLRDAAALRGVEISVVLRELLGVQAQPESSYTPRKTSESATNERKHKVHRPMRLAAPAGSDPVVVRLLASVANGLRQTADAIAGNDAMVADVDVAQLLGALQSMAARLAFLNEYEAHKNAH